MSSRTDDGAFCWPDVDVAAWAPTKRNFHLTLQMLGKLLTGAEKPYLAILGGAKVSDKIKVLDTLMTRVDGIAIGGAMAYTFLKASGGKVGKSRVEEAKLALASEILEKAQRLGIRLDLPIDHVCSDSPKGAPTVVEGDIPDDLMGLDIGPKTVTRFAARVAEQLQAFKVGINKPRSRGDRAEVFGLALATLVFKSVVEWRQSHAS